MLSSLNAFSGLSAANLLTLLGANSASSSSATSTSAAQSASTGVAASNANDPAKAIKAILAQAQMETSAGGTAGIATVAAAYAAQTAPSAGGSATSATAQAAPADQMTSAAPSLGVGATLSSLDSVSEAYNAGHGMTDTASLAVVTGNEEVSMTTGDANGDAYQALEPAVLFQASQALGIYQNQSTLAQQEQAASSASASATSAPSASASDATSDSVGTQQAEQPVLQLTIDMSQLNGNEQVLLPQVEAQAQQLISAFENSTLGSTSTNGNGFSYSENFGVATVAITGIVASSSDVPAENSGSSVPGFQNLVNESTTYYGGYGGDGGFTTFIIPLGNS